MSANRVTELGFELAYLSLLTQAGLKPLSRWEGRFGEATRRVLAADGLQTRVVTRLTRSGRRVRELLLSRSGRRIDLYARRFDGTGIRRDPASVRLEGRLFGYPSCCVEGFLAQPYARNALCREDQRILFHWACPGCVATPSLLPGYRRVYQECRRLRAAGGRRHAGVASLRRAAVPAASLLALGVAPALADPADPHWLVPAGGEDPDGDYLTSVEEGILGYDPEQGDENGNAVPDGADLAQALSAAMDLLPTAQSPVAPYVLHHPTFGLETCEVCGAEINMGLMEVVNPLENQVVGVPYIAKHFLEHGSFSYAGSVHAGRVNPPLLRMAVTGGGLGHFIGEAPGSDADDDGLRDAEEPPFHTDPALRDTDGDALIDGIDHARDLRAQLDALPHVGSVEAGPKDRPFVVEHPMDGVERCPRCGELVVMDVWEVINPVTGARLAVPSMALHHLLHGGFRWQGGQLMGGAGRADPRQLQAVLTGQGGKHLLDVAPDADADLLTDAEELALGTDPEAPDEDANQVPDGVDLARDVAGEIALLPTGPSTTRAYRVDFLLRGLEQCDACGTNVNMGHLVVCNPLAGLYAKVPFIGLHFLEHGSFAYAGDVHGNGRAAVRLLVDALRSTGPTHLPPLAGDADNDGLRDDEEVLLGTDPALWDSDGDGVPDGFALARALWATIDALPRTPGGGCHAVEHPSDGFVPCGVCGAPVRAGWLEVVCATPRRVLELPYLALHSMEHGSFAWGDGQRVDPLQLQALMLPAPRIAIAAGEVTLRWVGWPGRVYQVHAAADPAGPWAAAGQQFAGDGGELAFTEAHAAGGPKKFYKVVDEGAR